MNAIYFICGVSGCGKSTIGALLAERGGMLFYDGDDFHPEENISKMAAGLPLNDDDREGWLLSINTFVRAKSSGVVIACSALKEKYRQILQIDVKRDIYWIFLLGSHDVIYSRMVARKDHFMPKSLLKSQFDILDVPQYAITCDVTKSLDEIVNQILSDTREKEM